MILGDKSAGITSWASGVSELGSSMAQRRMKRVGLVAGEVEWWTESLNDSVFDEPRLIVDDSRARVVRTLASPKNHGIDIAAWSHATF